MNLEMYQKSPFTNKYNPNVLTKLIKNYRSHAFIIKIPNAILYEGEMIAAGSKGKIKKNNIKGIHAPRSYSGTCVLKMYEFPFVFLDESFFFNFHFIIFRQKNQNPYVSDDKWFYLLFLDCRQNPLGAKYGYFASSSISNSFYRSLRRGWKRSRWYQVIVLLLQ